MASNPQASLGVVAPLLPEGQGRHHLIVAACHSAACAKVHGGRRHGASRQAVFEGIVALPAAAHDPHRLGAGVQQPLGHGAAVGQAGGHEQGHGPYPVEGTGAVGGAHEQAFARHHLRGHRQGRIAQVEALQAVAAPFAGPQAPIRRPGARGRVQVSQVGEGLDRFGAVGERPGNCGGGPQHINHHGRIGPGAASGSARSSGAGCSGSGCSRSPNRGHRFGGGEVGNQHGRDAGQGASQ